MDTCQARNNARIVISGSLKMFSDEFNLDEAQSDFCNSVLLWVTKNSGVIRYSDLKEMIMSMTALQFVYLSPCKSNTAKMVFY